MSQQYNASSSATQQSHGRLTAQATVGSLTFMEYSHLITVEPDKRSGQACVRGLRITVKDVLEYLAGGMTVDELLRDFPDLTRDDIRACLAYAADRLRS